MAMAGAARIERSAAGRAHRCTAEILAHCQNLAARTAQDRGSVKFRHRPDLRWVIRRRLVTRMAWVKSAATRKPDRDNIRIAVIVSAPCLRTDIYTIDRRAMNHLVRRRASAHSSSFLKSRAAELMQYRLPVGFGPSLNKCPRWALQFPQTTSVRRIPWLSS